MKVVVSGSTGYIGNQILRGCLDHPSITSVLILTRRELKNDLTSNPKAKVIIVKDFTSYDDSIINELKDADAAIWCLGTFTGDEKVDIEYPLSFINAIKKHRSPSSTPFRYIQLGGAFTEPPPKEGEKERSLWYYAHARRVRGRTETTVRDCADDNVAVYRVKPGAVVPTTAVASVAQSIILLFTDYFSVRIDELQATMVDLAVNWNEKKLYRNAEIIARGRKLLAEKGK